jgi:hypothetical protein
VFWPKRWWRRGWKPFKLKRCVDCKTTEVAPNAKRCVVCAEARKVLQQQSYNLNKPPEVRLCEKCGNLMNSTGHGMRFCTECARERKRVYHREYMLTWRKPEVT